MTRRDGAASTHCCGRPRGRRWRASFRTCTGKLAEYEALAAGGQRTFVSEDFNGLPVSLIWARIAGVLSQRELAERLGLKEQQVQRYEATGYSSASLARVRAPGVTVREEVSLAR